MGRRDPPEFGCADGPPVDKPGREYIPKEIEDMGENLERQTPNRCSRVYNAPDLRASGLVVLDITRGKAVVESESMVCLGVRIEKCLSGTIQHNDVDEYTSCFVKSDV